MPILVPAPFPNRECIFGCDAIDAATPLVWTVESFLTREECAATIRRVDEIGFVPAPISSGGGFEMRPEVRNNTRVIVDDQPLANSFFERVREHVPERMFREATIAGVNERFRFYRYERSERFKPHYDGAFRRNRQEESLLTFMVYLNEEFEGGATKFLDLGIDVKPKTGLALFFQHSLLHEGSLVHEGVKYVLRTDIMYRVPAV